MDRIAIFAALRWEAAAARRCLRQVRRRRLGAATIWAGQAANGAEVWVVKTGVGGRRAAEVARLVGAAGPFQIFVSSGCAGALAAELSPGDLMLPASTSNGNGERYFSSVADLERACRAAERARLRTVPGTLLCSELALTTAEAKRLARQSCGAIGVDMESAAIAAAAEVHGARFFAVRAVLDTAEAELPDLIDPQTGSVRPAALARQLLTQPRTLGTLVGLQRMMAAARLTLERFHESWLST